MAFVSRQGFYSKSLAAWHEVHFFREFILVQVYEKCKYTNRTLKFPLSGYVSAFWVRATGKFSVRLVYLEPGWQSCGQENGPGRLAPWPG
jgi:hypothetical protein